MRKPPYIFHFSGLRRSGNHACINWLANSIYGRKVKYKQLDHYLFRQFPENKIFFINSYAQESALKVFRSMFKYRRQIRDCDYLFLSLEDESLQFKHFIHSKMDQSFSFSIHINRSLFNMLSSRSKKISVDTAKEGGGIANNFNVEEKLIEGLFAYRRSDLLQWEYDEWLVNPEWRNSFLGFVGLSEDIMPSMSVEAGGSSFDTDNKEGLNNAGRTRYKMQTIPNEWLSIIEEKYIDQLSTEEVEQLKEIRALVK